MICKYYTHMHHALLQAQAYYANDLPDLSSYILITFTWPLLACHLVQVV